MRSSLSATGTHCAQQRARTAFPSVRRPFIQSPTNLPDSGTDPRALRERVGHVDLAPTARSVRLPQANDDQSSAALEALRTRSMGTRSGLTSRRPVGICPRERLSDDFDKTRVIAQRYGVHLAERSVGAVLRRLGLRRLLVRPRNPCQDQAAQQTHKKIRRHSRSRHPARSARQADRTLVAGRSPRRPAGHATTGVERTRLSAAGAA